MASASSPRDRSPPAGETSADKEAVLERVRVRVRVCSRVPLAVDMLAVSDSLSVSADELWVRDRVRVRVW